MFLFLKSTWKTSINFSIKLSNISYQQVCKMQNKCMKTLSKQGFHSFLLLFFKNYGAYNRLEVMTGSDLHEENGEEEISMSKTADKKEPSRFKSLNHRTSTILLQKNVNYLLGAPPPTPFYIGRNQLPVNASL